MTVPSRVQAARILLDLTPPDWLTAHLSAVAEVAAFLAVRAGERGAAVDNALVEAAALLHDVDKLAPASELVATLGHGRAGAAWLAGNGYPELAPAVASHTALRLSEPAADAWLASASTAELLVAYADKRATQDVVTLDARFDEWVARYPARSAAIERGRRRGHTLETHVCTLAGVAPAAVERLPWVRDALEEARLHASASASRPGR